MGSLRVQFGLVAIRLFNIIYSALVFSRLRRLLLIFGRCRVGHSVGLHDAVRFTWIGRLSIGSHSTINMRTFLDARGHINIGQNVMIARCVSIYTMTHDYDSPTFANIVAPVNIGDNVIVFPHAVVMPGVTIGAGAIVYPGCVVTKDVLPDQIVAGVPSRVVGMRSVPCQYQLNYTYFFPNS